MADLAFFAVEQTSQGGVLYNKKGALYPFFLLQNPPLTVPNPHDSIVNFT